MIMGYQYEQSFAGFDESALPQKKKKKVSNPDGSVSDYMASKGMDNSFSNRSKLAKQYGIDNYSGTAAQNNTLLKQLRVGSPTKIQNVGSNNNAQLLGQKNNAGKMPGLQKKIVVNNRKDVPGNSLFGNIIDNIKQNAGPSYEQNNIGPYNSVYSTQIDQLLNKVLNRTPFKYEMNADPLYQQYKDQYTKEGNLAMRDTMGSAAGLTGGYGSSYASTAASQANDAYLSKLNNMIPELEQAAYQKYMNEANADATNLGLLQGLDQQNYAQYRDKVGDWQTNRDYYYGKDYNTQQQNNWQNEYDRNVNNDSLQQQNWQSTFDYGKTQDALSQKNFEDQFAYQKEMDNKEFNLSKAKFDLSSSRRGSSGSGSSGSGSNNQNSNKQNTSVPQTAQDKMDAKESIQNIKLYTIRASKMLNNGESPQKIMDYLFGLDLTDDEIANIANNLDALGSHVTK
jgi:hypothetical protein